MNNIPHIVAFGGGVDSTAMIIGLINRKQPIDLILFADTGGEKPHTYDHIEAFSQWLKDHGYPEITVVKKVRKDGSIETLEEECLRRSSLPSIAYGFKTCSQKHKIQPQEKFVNNWQPALDCWSSGNKVFRYVGYDADESHRAANADKRNDPKYQNIYPLIDWDITREDCIDLIKEAGLEPPGKSACFFCPSSKKQEIVDLYKNYPDLMQRAINMEQKAELTAIKGLGRSFSWHKIIELHDNQQELPFTGFDLPCECTE